MSAFEPFPKIPRLSRDIVVSEKIDGTNASIKVAELSDAEALADGTPWICGLGGFWLAAGSRTRWLSIAEDNFGFARWVHDNATELLRLGVGHHFGEWWGSGIQRGYGLSKGEKRFSLFNTAKWSDPAVRPACCHVVPILYTGAFDSMSVEWSLDQLALMGSTAAPGFMAPEGVIVFHTAANMMFKKTILKDSEPKSILHG